MSSDIQFGITYPAGQQRHCDLAIYVERAEAAGYDSFWVIDNLSSGSPGLECLSVLSFAAARSSRMKLGTSVMLLPLRSPVVTTQACNTIDVLSNGRFVLGVGVGDPGSHVGVGGDPSQRGKKTTEYLRLVRELWAEGPTRFTGDTIQIDGYELTPRPIQDPHPPIWIGGHVPAAVTRAAHYADGFIAVGDTPQEAGALFDSMDEQAKALGRGPLTRVAHLYLGFANDTQEAAARVNAALTDRYQHPIDIGGNVEPHFLGTEADVLRVAREFLDVGVTHFILDPTGDGTLALEHAEHFASHCREQILTG